MGLATGFLQWLVEQSSGEAPMQYSVFDSCTRCTRSSKLMFDGM